MAIVEGNREEKEYHTPLLKGIAMQDERNLHQSQPASRQPLLDRIGLSIIATDAADAVNRIIEAERAGLRQVWLAQGGSGGTDTLTIAAMAAMRTTQIRLGTAIVPIYPRHPLVMAQQALAIYDLAPGRLRLGIGPSHRPIIEGSYGLQMPSPLAYLQEYVSVLRGLLSQGQIDHHGTFFQVKATSHTASIPLLVSALGKRAFRLAGEISDGALSWVCPVPYLLNEALPSLQAGAMMQSRPVPALVAHVVVALSTDEAAVQDQARQFLLRYSKLPFYAQMFESAGLPVAADGAGLDVLAKALVISGDGVALREQLSEILSQGLSEVMVHPLPMTNTDKERAQLLQVLASLAWSIPGATKREADRFERNHRVVEEFRANGGKVQGWLPLILLTTKGAKSGIERVYPLMAVPYEGQYLAVASKGGAPENPAWYYNLLAHPHVTIEVGQETFAATARLLTGEERTPAFAQAIAVFPPYREYQQKTARQIPVFLLERQALT